MRWLGRLSGSVMTLLTGTALSQLVLFVGSPFLTRLYEPAAFGQYAMLSLVLSLVVVFSTGKYEVAILLPRSDDDAWSLVCLACGITTAVTAAAMFLAMGVLLLFPELALLLGAEAADRHAVLVGLGGAMVFLSGWQGVLFVWMNRRGFFRSISISRVTQSIVMVAAQLALSFWVGGLFGLLIGNILGLSLCLAAQIYVVVKTHAQAAPSWAGLKRLAREHANLPTHVIPTDLIGILLAQFPVFFLGARFSDAAVGYYSLAQRTLLAPMQLISSSVGEVFRRRASAEVAEQGQCRAYFDRTALRLGALALLAIVVILAFGPDLFTRVFGANWRVAGEFAQILIFMFALKFIVSPLSFMFIIVKKTRFDLVLHSGFLAMLLAVFYFAAPVLESPQAALVLFVLVYSGLYLVFFYFSRRYAKGLF